ncbi:MAG: potassium-transporting ATPase subunit C [Lentisphaerae bacterium RIFOXYB12_FULL_65_16]|nr:MAG: potassium-transporting ATPase subunit C [Lentisphaerae bacterium RIFOXYA12_64_32]OGV90407.1 MAG: potassium-transporting ATPase subunit C [Lentisphaerae bacterium RIFOXYB12_FULL_65_16]
MKDTILPALRLLAALTVLTGAVYPLLITAVARAVFPRQAAGSLVQNEGSSVGSELLAQKFGSPRYFQPRPSAADFATVPSGASNLGPTSAVLRTTAQDRAAAVRAACGLAGDTPVPGDLLCASGSGLDPHISPESARLQLDRVARTRGLTPEHRARLESLVTALTEPPQFGVLGEPRVNVLCLNLALDRL